MFEHLLQPGQIGKMKLKNRMKFSATTTNFCDNGEITSREVAFVAERAKGGAALVSSGGGYPHILGKGYTGQIGLCDDKFIPGLRRLAQVIQGSEAKAMGQILHAGRYAHTTEYGLDEPPVGPTAMKSKLPRYLPCRELSNDEIKQLVEIHGQAARRIKEAGFDAVDIGCLGGYLIISFLCPLTNKRTDEYGGSLGNRARFAVEIIQRVRKEVGQDYPVTIKTLATDLLTEGGNTDEEYIEIAKMFEAAGVDAISLAVGTHESELPAITPEIEPGHWLYLAERHKKAGIKVPLMMSYRLNRPEVVERAIAEGVIDFWEMSRPMIADPYLPMKVTEGRPEDISPCIACTTCFEHLFSDKPILCAINPRAGREAEKAFQIKPAETKRKVMVVGGGPAGMEAATVAALRGHQVILEEETDRLGGKLLAASVAPYKYELNKLTDSLGTQVAKAGAEVRLNSGVTAKSIEQIKPDVIILATGSLPLAPDIPGVERSNVVTALDVLNGKMQVGNEVVIIGGGMVGCEAAEVLVRVGKKVTILEMLRHIGQDIGAFSRWHVIGRLKQAGVRLETKTKAEQILDTGVQASREDGSQFFPADTVVLATGMTPNQELAQELEGRVPAIHTIGDCRQSRKIREAIEEGFHVGAEV